VIMADPLSADYVFSIDPPTPVDKGAHRGLIRATVDALLFSDGRVIMMASLKPDECECLAIEQRAETGVVPYGLWAALTDEARGKLARMSQAKARRALASENTNKP
jgi:hypothetical protein